MLELAEPRTRPLPCSEAMMRVRNALDRPSPLEGLRPALPAVPPHGLAGLRSSRSSPGVTSFLAMEAAARDAPDVNMPPHLFAEPPGVGALMAAARASLQMHDAPPPPSGLEPALGSRASSQPPCLGGDSRLARSDIDRREQLEQDSAAGPPPAVPQLSGRGMDRSISSNIAMMNGTSGSVNAASAAHVAAAAAARAEVAALAAAARADASDVPVADARLPCALATAALEARKLPPSPAWLDEPHSKADRFTAGTSMDESFGVCGSTSMGQWRSGRSPAGPGSLLSAVSTAVPERSRPGTPRQDKDSSLPEKLSMELDFEPGAAASMHGHLGERGLKTRGYDKPYQKYRSFSMPPVSSRAPVRPYAPSYSSLALPVVPGWQQVAASVTPLAVTMTPATVAAPVPYPVAICNPCTTSWFPPPLPPVPCELTARLEALEQEMHSPQPLQDPTLSTDSRDIPLEQARLDQMQLERSVESLRKQLAVSEAAAARSSVLEAQLVQSRLEWKQQLEKLEASAEVEKMTAAQEAEFRVRTEESLKHQFATSEAEQLRRELQAARTTEEQAKRAREEFERMHAEVLAGNARLEADLRKLQIDFDQERRAKQAMEADAMNVKLDSEKLQLARDAELHSTRADFLSRHQAVEELNKKLQADLQQMDLDRSHEARAREEVQQRFDAVFADAEKLRADILHIQADRDAGQHAHEDLEQKRRSAEAGKEQLRKELLQLQGQLQLVQDTQSQSREELEQHHRVANSEVTQLQGSLRQAQEAVQQTEGALRSAEEKVRTYELRFSSIHMEIEELRSRLVKAEAERDQLADDKANLQGSQELEKGHVILQQQLKALEDENTAHRQRIESLTLQLQQDQRGDVELLERVRDSLEAERDQLQNDVTHLKKANRMREESELNLRKGIEEERKTVRELQVRLESKEREFSDALEMRSKVESGSDARVTEVLERLRVVETERDRLQSDTVHLRRAKEQREESEASLRKGLEAERKTVREVKSQLQAAELKLRDASADFETRSRETRIQLETKELELMRVKEGRRISKDQEETRQPAEDDSRAQLMVDLTDDMDEDVAPAQAVPKEPDGSESENGAVLEVDLTDEMDGPSWGRPERAKSEFWDSHEDDLGRTYYSNSITGEIAWEAKSSQLTQGSLRGVGSNILPRESF